MLYAIRADGEDIPLYIVTNQSWGGAQSAIIYESPGSDGGIVIVTGRTTNTINLSGKLLAQSSPPLVNLNNIKSKFMALKNKGTPIVLTAPIDNDDTGIYIITNFTGNVIEGMSNYLSFSMELTEYRQANVKQSIVNLISFSPAEEFRRVLNERLQGG